MEILVCIKQVPAASVAVDPETGTLCRDGAGTKLNPYDLYAIEAALRLAAECDANVTALTLGPPQAWSAVHEAILMGADCGILVTDRCFAGSDVLSTARALSQAVAAAGRYDLILCGKQSTDGDTAQAGAELSVFLGIPYAGCVVDIETPACNQVRVKCAYDAMLMTAQLPLPCLLSLGDGINTPRLPSFRRLNSFDEQAIRTLTLVDFPCNNPTYYGQSGSPTRVERIFPPEHNIDHQMTTGDADELANQLLTLLNQKKFWQQEGS